jgi:RNA polymerase sigma-70 factor (ECF subfamily)
VVGGPEFMGSADERSFEELALPHLDTVYRVARRLSRDEHEAEDLVQETYFKAYRAFANFDLREFGIRPWLLKILNNTFLNRHAREKKAPKATDHVTLEQTQASNESGAPPDLDYESLDEEVKRALDGLKPEFRSVMLLWATNELSYQEIADVLEVPIGTVMSRLHRARQQLAQTLRDFALENRIGQVKTEK